MPKIIKKKYIIRNILECLVDLNSTIMYGAKIKVRKRRKKLKKSN